MKRNSKCLLFMIVGLFITIISALIGWDLDLVGMFLIGVGVGGMGYDK